MSSSRPPAIVFDFGNVVAFFDYTIAAERFGRPLGLSGEEFLRRARAAGFAEVLADFERGTIAADEFHRRLCERTGLACGLDEFQVGWADIFRPNEPVHRLIAVLKSRGYTLGLGSNTNAIHAPHFQRQFPDLFRHFDALVLSHEVGHLKPDARFYLACAASVGREPGNCVFIDDLAENVEGARAAGLVGLHYTGDDALIAGLRSLGVDATIDEIRPGTPTPP